MEMLQELDQLKAENALLKKILFEQSRFQEQPEKKESEVFFVDFYEQWLKHKKSELQPSTHFEYTRIFENYIAPYFQPKKKLLCEMVPEDISTYYRYLKSSKGMRNASIIRHHANLHTCFKYAYMQGQISSMLMDKVKRPRQEQPTGFNYYTMDEMLELFAVARGRNIYTPILLGAILGLRRSELLALKWDAVNFHAGTVTIRRKMTRDKKAGKDTVSNRLKSEASQRTLALPDFLLSYLMMVQKNTASLPTREWASFICVDPDGKLPTLNSITNRFRDLIQR